MPIYEYACVRCGPFAALRPLAERNVPLRCPSCNEFSIRGIFTAPSLGALSSQARRAHVINERSVHEPRRASMRPNGTAPSAATGSEPRVAHGRPWMIGH